MWRADPQGGVRIFDVRAPEECALIGHAAMAIHALAAAGFTKLVNIPDGMEGDLVDDHLQRLRRHTDALRLARRRPALDLPAQPEADEATSGPRTHEDGTRMIWAILAILGVPLWLCALGISVLVFRTRALKGRPGNMSVRVLRPGRTRWIRANAIWVSEVFV